MREPNNLRNRYRRYLAAQRAYNFNPRTFREWALYGQQNPQSYSVNPWEVTEGYSQITKRAAV